MALVDSLLRTTNQHHATSQHTKDFKLHCARSLKTRTEYRLFYIQNLRNLQCSSLPGPNIFLCTLNTLNLCSSHIVRDQVSHTYETSAKAVIHYILIFLSSDTKQEDQILWTEWQQAFTEFNLHLMSSCRQILFVSLPIV